MSLFGSLMREMERDPIFGAHHRAMNRMMNSFFGAPAAGGFGGMSLMGPAPMGHGHGHHEEHDDLMPFGGGALSPFGAFGGFPDVSRMMSMDPGNGHSFSSSSFVSISSGPDGRPQVYQASAETRQGPDGLRETRKSVQDSRAGTKRMAVGRHLDERGHIVEREQNMRTGQMNENHEFYNLEEEEAPRFDQEWRQRAHLGGRAGIRGSGYSHSPSLPAIASSAAASQPSSYVEHPSEEPVVVEEDGGYNNSHSIEYQQNQPHRSQSAVTIEELPASDDETEQLQHARSSRRSYPHASSSAAAASTASSSRRSPYGTSKEKRQKRSKLGKKY